MFSRNLDAIRVFHSLMLANVATVQDLRDVCASPEQLFGMRPENMKSFVLGTVIA